MKLIMSPTPFSGSLHTTARDSTILDEREDNRVYPD
jgi:hypothetical protein